VNLNTPVHIDFVDDLLPGGNRNRMSVTVWIAAPDADADADDVSITRALTIGFVERVLEAIRQAPEASFRSEPIVDAAVSHRSNRADVRCVARA
jgi:hypothetical protein